MKKNEIITLPDYSILRIFSKEEVYDFLIDTEDVERISVYNWHIHKSSSNIYARSTMNYKKVRLHRYIMNYNGNQTIDHINRNTFDNRKSNLRIVTSAENNQNKNALCVYKKKNTWVVNITFYGEKYKLCGFKTKKDAIIARNNKRKELESQREILAKKYYEKKPERNVSPRPYGKWSAYVSIHGRIINLGTYNTKEEAIAARDAAEAEKHKQAV